MAKNRIKGAVFFAGRTFKRGDEQELSDALDAMEPKQRQASADHLVKTRAVEGFGGKEVKEAELSIDDPTLAARRRNSDTDEIEDDEDDHVVIDAVDTEAAAEEEAAAPATRRRKSGAAARGRGK